MRKAIMRKLTSCTGDCIMADPRYREPSLTPDSLHYIVQDWGHPREHYRQFAHELPREIIRENGAWPQKTWRSLHRFQPVYWPSMGWSWKEVEVQSSEEPATKGER